MTAEEAAVIEPDALIEVHGWWDSGPYGGWFRGPGFGNRDERTRLIPARLMDAYEEAVDAQQRAEDAIDEYVRARDDGQDPCPSPIFTVRLVQLDSPDTT